MTSEVQKRAARVKLLLMDCDGVLTDGRVWLFDNEDEQKGFHTRDGLGIALLQRAGLKSGIISGRTSTAVQKRADGLGMSFSAWACGQRKESAGRACGHSAIRLRCGAFVFGTRRART